MFVLNVYSLVLILFILLVTYVMYSRLRLPLEYQHISITKSLWSEILISCELAMKKPKDLLPFFTKLINIHGPVVHFNLAGQANVVLNDPDDIKILLSSHEHIKKGPEYVMLKPWLNEGLLLSSGLKWKNRRKLLTNAFHFKTLHMYTPSINKHSRVLAKKLLEVSETNKKLNIMEYITLCSLDIVCDTIMGTEMKAQEGKSIQYVNSIKSACRSVIERIFNFWLWTDVIFAISKCGRTFYTSTKVLHDYTDKVIKNKQALNNSGINTIQSKNTSFLDLILQISENNPDEMTDKDIREEVDTFLFEGHDTSSISMTMTLLLLGMYEGIQDRVRDELRLIFGDSDRDPTIEDLNAMKYLDAVIKESLRLYPSVPGISRLLQSTLHLKNYDILPMTSIMVFPYILHRNKDIYTNPEKFIPERFLDEDNKTKLLYGYLPFSAGPRNCIGQKFAMNQMKSVISAVLRKMKIETLGNIDDIHISMQLILRIESLPHVKLYKI